MIDAGEAKVFMSTRDTLIRAYMAGAILALAAVFAVTVAVQTGVPIVGAILFPVGFCMLYLLGFDLLTGVFTLLFSFAIFALELLVVSLQAYIFTVLTASYVASATSEEH